MIDCSHIPLSIAITDSLTKDPIFIEGSDPEALIEAFMKELTFRQEIVSNEVWKMYPMVEMEKLPERVQETWAGWVNLVPVVGFNSENYELSLVKEYFVKTLSNVNDVTVEKKDNSYMFLKTSSFKFLDVENYLAPGLSYDGWCKANGCEVQNLFFCHMND